MEQKLFEQKLSEVADWQWVESARIGQSGRILKATESNTGGEKVIHITKIHKPNCHYIIRYMQYSVHNFWYKRCEHCKKIQDRKGRMHPQPKLTGPDYKKKIWDIYNSD